VTRISLKPLLIALATLIVLSTLLKLQIELATAVALLALPVADAFAGRRTT